MQVDVKRCFMSHPILGLDLGLHFRQGTHRFMSNPDIKKEFSLIYFPVAKISLCMS